MPRMSSVRRLYLEAYTLAMAELKRSIEAPSDEARPQESLMKALIGFMVGAMAQGFKALHRPYKAPRPVPLLEREERQNA